MIQSIREHIGDIVMTILPWYNKKEASERARDTERAVETSKSAVQEGRALLLKSYETSDRMLSIDRKIHWR